MSNNTNYMRMLTNGNFGIGTTNPSQKLDVVGNIKVSGNIDCFGNYGLNDKDIRLRTVGDGNHSISYTNDESVDGPKIKGNLGGLISAQASGTHARWKRVGTENQFQSGHFNSYSDDRLKYGETMINDALITIRKINPVSYRKTNSIDQKDNIDLNIEWGIVAQELYNNVPELRHAVSFDKKLKRNFVDGDLEGDCIEDIYSYTVSSDNIITEEPDIVAVQYDNFHALSIKAIQELLDKVEKLESRILELEKL